MANRHLFPQDRLAYVYSNAPQPVIRAAVGRRIKVFTDSGATRPADILSYPSEQRIADSTVSVGKDTLIEQFWGPPGALLLYGQAVGTAATYRMATADLIGLGEPGDGTSYVHYQTSASALWVIDHELGFDPNVVTTDQTGMAIWGETDYRVPGRVLWLVFDTPVAGIARLSG